MCILLHPPPCKTLHVTTSSLCVDVVDFVLFDRLAFDFVFLPKMKIERFRERSWLSIEPGQISAGEIPSPKGSKGAHHDALAT